jgi:hypothetical protein
MMTGIQYLKSLHEICAFQSHHHGTGKASNSELTRWLRDKSLRINGKPIGPTEPIPFPITSVVLFPKSREKRCTLL